MNRPCVHGLIHETPGPTGTRGDELEPLERFAAHADTIADTVADGGEGGLPPVHLWDPAHCGDIGMEIRRDGSWWRNGSRIARERLVKLFARILRKDDDDNHYLVTPREKVLVRVEIAPFTAVRLDAVGPPGGRRLRFTTNLGDEVDAGDDRPIRVYTDPVNGAPSPFVLVRARLEALMTRSVFFDLVELAAEQKHPDGGAQLVVGSRGAAFPLGRIRGGDT